MHRKKRQPTRRRVFEPCESRLCLSTIGFASHDIELPFIFQSASSVTTADLDGDGDLDVISNLRSHKIIWYRNIDGQGSLGPPQTISVFSNEHSIEVADLDRDGDLDVLSASTRDSKIAWYENTDGQGNFGSQQVITNQVGHFTSLTDPMATGDLDGDGDMDVLYFSARTIAWYENMDGEGSFGLEREIENPILSVAVAVDDLDGDGDMDVLSATPRSITWYENTDGNGTFSDPQLIAREAEEGCFIHSLTTADIDGDGDLDVLTGGYNEEDYPGAKVGWYENTDGQGSFGPQQLITLIEGDDGLVSIAAADLDNDGDMDVLSASDIDGSLAWYENTNGRGVFGQPQLIASQTRGAWSVATADLDGDGDLDVLSAFRRDNKIAWYAQRPIGDANDDGVFNSSDLVRVFQSGEYEDGIGENSTFDEGDWNGDGEFDSEDLVAAFQAGHYEAGARLLATDMAAAVDRLFAQDEEPLRGKAFIA